MRLSQCECERHHQKEDEERKMNQCLVVLANKCGMYDVGSFIIKQEGEKTRNRNVSTFYSWLQAPESHQTFLYTLGKGEERKRHLVETKIVGL